jgi:hypothetical protein
VSADLFAGGSFEAAGRLSSTGSVFLGAELQFQKATPAEIRTSQRNKTGMEFRYLIHSKS